jgi:hypothetical protein
MTAANTPARSATAGAAPARPWLAVTREVAGDRVDRVVFAAVAAVAGFGYSVLLPFDYTQRVSLANWQYFGPRYAAFAVAFAGGLAWVVTLQVHAVRRIARTARASAGRPGRGGPVGAAAAVVVSLLPSLLCCSPVVPTLVGLLGLPVATQLQTTGTITYFFATKQDWLLGGALALLAATGLWSVRKLARAACLAGDGCELPAASAGTAAAAHPGPPGDDEPGQQAPAAAGDHGHEVAGEQAHGPRPAPGGQGGTARPVPNGAGAAPAACPPAVVDHRQRRRGRGRRLGGGRGHGKRAGHGGGWHVRGGRGSARGRLGGAGRQLYHRLRQNRDGRLAARAQGLAVVRDDLVPGLPGRHPGDGR